MLFTLETISFGLQWELERRVTGPVLIYVDDIFSISLRKDFQRDLDAAADYCCKLMGPDAVDIPKSISWRALVPIDYNIGLDQRQVHISESCVKRALYGSMTTDAMHSITVHGMIRLGSWASRYGRICRHMRSFTPSSRTCTSDSLLAGWASCYPGRRAMGSRSRRGVVGAW
jgi:hypothetical protein